MSGGSGSEVGYRIEVRATSAFVAWELKGYECGRTPKGEFVIDHDWTPVPLAYLPEPLGIAPANLSGGSHFAAGEGLVCYETAKAIQFALLSRFKYRPTIDVRIAEVRFDYSYTAKTRFEAPIRSLFDAHFVAQGIEARQGGDASCGSVHESPVANGDAPKGDEA